MFINTFNTDLLIIHWSLLALVIIQMETEECSQLTCFKQT